MAKAFPKSLMMVSMFTLLACTPKAENTLPVPVPTSAQDQFIANLKAHCGKAYSGKLVSADTTDVDMASQSMTMHVDCAGNGLRIPFTVGDNRSRTWIFTKTNTGLRLKHQHNHKDGTPDAVSMYGGDTVNTGTATRQEFPVDDFSKTLFKKNGLDVSVTNIWAVDITPEIYAYELRRKNRHFRVEFDLTKEIPAPQKPW